MISIRNPHSILAILQTRPQDLLEIYLPDRPTAAWERVRAEVEAARLVPIQKPRVDRPSRADARKEGRTGATEAVVRPRSETPFQDVFPESPADGLWIALDAVQDPHNVGAIFRTAAFFGVRGLLLPRDRTASLSGTVYDVASGAVEHLPFSIQPNLSRALQAAKDRGYWILGSSETAPTTLSAVNRDRPWLLVLGNEEEGLRRLTLDACDEVCRIPASGPIGSLNVSVAAGILIHHLTL